MWRVGNCTPRKDSGAPFCMTPGYLHAPRVLLQSAPRRVAALRPPIRIRTPRPAPRFARTELGGRLRERAAVSRSIVLVPDKRGYGALPSTVVRLRAVRCVVLGSRDDYDLGVRVAGVCLDVARVDVVEIGVEISRLRVRVGPGIAGGHACCRRAWRTARTSSTARRSASSGGSVPRARDSLSACIPSATADAASSTRVSGSSRWTAIRPAYSAGVRSGPLSSGWSCTPHENQAIGTARARGAIHTRDVAEIERARRAAAEA